MEDKRLIALVWLVALGIFVYNKLDKDHSLVNDHTNANSLNSTLERAPASLGKLEENKEQPLSQIIKLNCISDSETNITTKSIRLDLSSCKKFSGLRVKNFTNNFEASLFESNDTLMSDHIPLNEGKNKIEIQILKKNDEITSYRFKVIKT